MKLELAGETAIVTGASRGIGPATVRTMLDEDVNVVGAARDISPESGVALLEFVELNGQRRHYGRPSRPNAGRGSFSRPIRNYDWLDFSWRTIACPGRSGVNLHDSAR